VGAEVEAAAVVVVVVVAVAKVRARGSLRHRGKDNLHRPGNPKVNLRRKGKGKSLRRRARVSRRDNRHLRAKVSPSDNLLRKVKARASRHRKTLGALRHRLASRPGLRRTRQRRQTINRPPGR
jgi:hypothetical protein